ncbi:cytochrome P450 [Vararia minispora EC-137]|uniref:Cytochrome P450 n=1 Tax=Vararia minispora EC-137 TaxID=1314806 RepID=A0ACB8QIP1_9AGAM|nr:cytochrome P450 [Vararia minispora EC-137]
MLHPFYSGSRIHKISGPKPKGLLGNIKELSDHEPTTVYQRWVEDHGHILGVNTLLFFYMLYLADPRAVAHVLAHHVDYPMHKDVRKEAERVLGEGKARFLSPAFGPYQIRELQSIFYDKCSELCELWIQRIKSENTTRNPADTASVWVEATSWLNKMTLDVVGLAGFNSSFDSLNPDGMPNELSEALRAMLAVNGNPSVLDYLHAFLPITRIIPSQSRRKVDHARKVMDRIGRELIADAKSATRATASGDISRKNFAAKDLLSLLVRANMASDVPDSSRLSDEEVLAQIPTFLFAGHETTSSALACFLFSIACNPEVQDRLRAEAFACAEGDRPTAEALNKLPYLDSVVRETLRLYAPVSAMLRTVTKDDIIPTESRWIDNEGVEHSGIPVVAGDSIIIPILAMNRSKAIWGDDAYEFKPERWTDLPATASSIPGVWGSSMTFSGGLRACIGYRFAIAQMKATAYTLIRTFRFALAVDPAQIEISVNAMTRPVIRGKAKEGPNLPLWVGLVESESAL